MILEIVAPEVYVCVPDLLNTMAPLPPLDSVMVPPVAEKSPVTFNVPIMLPEDIVMVPPVIEKLPVTFSVLAELPKVKSSAIVQLPVTLSGVCCNEIAPDPVF